MEPPDNKNGTDPFEDWGDESDNFDDFNDDKDYGEEARRITVDQSIQMYMNAVTIMTQKELIDLAPFIVETDTDKYDEQMFWISNIASILIGKMVEFGIPIYPKNVNNAFSYATIIYIAALSGDLNDDTLDDSEESSS